MNTKGVLWWLLLIYQHMMLGSQYTIVNFIGSGACQLTPQGHSWALNYAPPHENVSGIPPLQKITSTFSVPSWGTVSFLYAPFSCTVPLKIVLGSYGAVYLLINGILGGAQRFLQGDIWWSHWCMEEGNNDEDMKQHAALLLQRLQERYSTLPTVTERIKQLETDCCAEKKYIGWYRNAQTVIKGFIAFQALVIQAFLRGGIFFVTPLTHSLPLPACVTDAGAFKAILAVLVYMHTGFISKLVSASTIRHLFLIDDTLFHKCASRLKRLAYIQRLAHSFQGSTL